MILSRERIDTIRGSAGLTLEDVARKGKCSTITLHKARTGREVSPLAAGRIARALSVSVEDLLEHQGEA